MTRTTRCRLVFSLAWAAALRSRGLAVVLLLALQACGASDGSQGDSSPDATPADLAAKCPDICAHWRSIGCGDPLSDCVDSCTNNASSPLIAPCSSLVLAVYDCELEQATTEYECQGALPHYKGTACAQQQVAASDCTKQHAEPEPDCERVCELDGAVCGSNDVADCRDRCALISQLGDCIDKARAYYECIAAFETSALVCGGGQLSPADHSCDDELDAFGKCGA
jgi:hypothetical protein